MFVFTLKNIQNYFSFLFLKEKGILAKGLLSQARISIQPAPVVTARPQKKPQEDLKRPRKAPKDLKQPKTQQRKPKTKREEKPKIKPKKETTQKQHARNHFSFHESYFFNHFHFQKDLTYLK